MSLRLPPAEEAHLRRALAERERALADALDSTDARFTQQDILRLREAVAWLRTEIELGGVQA